MQGKEIILHNRSGTKITDIKVKDIGKYIYDSITEEWFLKENYLDLVDQRTLQRQRELNNTFKPSFKDLINKEKDSDLFDLIGEWLFKRKQDPKFNIKLKTFISKELIEKNETSKVKIANINKVKLITI